MEKAERKIENTGELYNIKQIKYGLSSDYRISPFLHTVWPQQHASRIMRSRHWHRNKKFREHEAGKQQRNIISEMRMKLLIHIHLWCLHSLFFCCCIKILWPKAIYGWVYLANGSKVIRVCHGGWDMAHSSFHGSRRQKVSDQLQTWKRREKIK